MFVILWILAVISKGTSSLRLLHFEVPESIVLGEPVWLNCSFDLEKDELYSIKWYKNNVEFYRHLPTDTPPAQKYDLPGIFIDLRRTGKGVVYLYKTDLDSEGSYRCEVSAEAPSFQTVRREKEMHIYVLPKEGPVITGTDTHYHIGDYVNATCRAGPSKPVSVLKWFLNEREVPSDYEVHHTSMEEGEKIRSSILGLRFKVKKEHFRKGRLKLSCHAIISQAYTVSSEEVIASNNIKAAGYRSGPIGDGPTISTGSQMRYHAGDIMDVNCTSARSRSPSELKWFINDKEADPQFLRRYPSVRYSNGQQSSVLGLQFKVQHHHFQKDEIRLKCTATLSRVINTSFEEKIIDSMQHTSGLHAYENKGALSNNAKSDVTRVIWGLLSGAMILAIL